MTETEALLLNALEQLQTTHSATFQELSNRLETLEKTQGKLMMRCENLVTGYNALLRAQEELEQSQKQLADVFSRLLKG